MAGGKLMHRSSSSAVICFLALATLMVAACGSTSAAATPKTYTGMLTFAGFQPFTGPDAAFGPELMAGCFPAVSLINAAGGILGHQTQCIPVDSRGDPADAGAAANKMLATTQNLVGLVGPSSDEALATVPLINRAHVTMFGDTGQAAFDKQTQYPYFWRITPPDDAAGVAMAIYAFRKGYRRGAAIFGNDISSQGNVPTLVSTFKKLGGQIVANETLSLDQSSYRSEVQTLINSNADVMFTEADPQTDATFIIELQQLHVLIPIVGTEPTVQPPWLQAVGGAIGKSNLAQYYAAAQPYSPSQGPAWDVYNTALLAAKAAVPDPGQWSQDPYSETTYDSIIIMALAMLVAKTPDPNFYNQHIPDVVSGSTEVHSYQEGKDAIAAGKTIKYVGAGGPVDFDKYHNSPGAFEIVGYTPDGNNPQLDVVTVADIDKVS